MGFANAQVAVTRSLDHDQPWDPGSWQNSSSVNIIPACNNWCHRGSALTPRGGFKTFANICFIIRELLALTPLLVAQLESFSASDGIEAVQRDWEDNSLKFCNFVLKIGAVSGAGVHTALHCAALRYIYNERGSSVQNKARVWFLLHCGSHSLSCIL